MVTALVYRCPFTGKHVQEWIADDGDDDDQIFEKVTCNACYRAHLVNTKTGKVLSLPNNN